MIRLSDGTAEREIAELAAQKQAAHTRRISDMEARLDELERKIEGLEALLAHAGLIDSPIPYQVPQPQPTQPTQPARHVLTLGCRLDCIILRDDAVTCVIGGYDSHGKRVLQRLELPYVLYAYFDQTTLRATQTTIEDYRTQTQLKAA